MVGAQSLAQYGAIEDCWLQKHLNLLLDQEDEGELNELDLSHIALEVKQFLPTDIQIIDCLKILDIATVTHLFVDTRFEHGCIIIGGYWTENGALCDPLNMCSSVSPAGPAREFPLGLQTLHCGDVTDFKLAFLGSRKVL